MRRSGHRRPARRRRGGAGAGRRRADHPLRHAVPARRFARAAGERQGRDHGGERRAAASGLRALEGGGRRRAPRLSRDRAPLADAASPRRWATRRWNGRPSPSTPSSTSTTRPISPGRRPCSEVDDLDRLARLLRPARRRGGGSVCRRRPASSARPNPGWRRGARPPRPMPRARRSRARRRGRSPRPASPGASAGPRPARPGPRSAARAAAGPSPSPRSDCPAGP